MSALLYELRKRMPNRVRWVSKQFPLSFHKQAKPAAIAALAAHQQGKYWPMHDALFADRKALGEEQYKALAKQLGLDLTRFIRDSNGKGILGRISQDMQEARKAGLRGTPTLFVNGRRYTGRQTTAAGLQEDIERYIEGKME